MQQEEGKSLAIVIIDFKVNFAYVTFTDIIFIVMHFKLNSSLMMSLGAGALKVSRGGQMQ